MAGITEKGTGPEIAAMVSETLRKAGLKAVLSGGTLVTLYAGGEYVSKDVDQQLVTEFQTTQTKKGEVVALTPTDAVKDRLAGFLHWKDPQNLEQARVIARDCDIDSDDVLRWAKAEGADREQLAEIRAILRS